MAAGGSSEAVTGSWLRDVVLDQCDWHALIAVAAATYHGGRSRRAIFDQLRVGCGHRGLVIEWLYARQLRQVVAPGQLAG